MINVQEFLSANDEPYVYCKIGNEYVYFVNLGEDEDWFLESPCQLYWCDINSKEFHGLNEDNGIDKGDRCYYIENFQCAPYLPKEVESIEVVSELDVIRELLRDGSCWYKSKIQEEKE